jgi:hypothetical protein
MTLEYRATLQRTAEGLSSAASQLSREAEQQRGASAASGGQSATVPSDSAPSGSAEGSGGVTGESVDSADGSEMMSIDPHAMSNAELSM